MLKINLEFLYNKRKDAPILRGRVYSVNFLLQPLLAYTVFQNKTDKLTKLTFSTYFISFYLCTLICVVYHGSSCKVIDRSLYARIDYASIFVQIVTNFLPSFVYFIENDTHVILLMFHTLLNFAGAFVSLFMDFIETSRRFRVVVFWVGTTCTNFLLYSYLKNNMYVPASLFLLTYIVAVCAGLVYSSGKPNLIPGVFEFIELSHLLYTIGSVTLFYAHAISMGLIKHDLYYLT